MPTITLHWNDNAGSRQVSVVCEDAAPQALLPFLIAGCGLPTHTADGQAVRYVLRSRRPGRPTLHPALALSAQQIHDGAQLWLVAADSGAPVHGPLPSRCLLGLPDGCGEIGVPARGLTLDRGWLLRALELLDPTVHARETALLARRRSPLLYVSGRPHCRIAPQADGGWSLATDRDDVQTYVNDTPIHAGSIAPLADGDRLRLGDAGPLLTVVLV